MQCSQTETKREKQTVKNELKKYTVKNRNQKPQKARNKKVFNRKIVFTLEK